MLYKINKRFNRGKQSKASRINRNRIKKIKHRIEYFAFVVLCGLLSALLIIEYPILVYATDDSDSYISSGQNAAVQALQQAGQSMDSITSSLNQGQTQINIQGIDNPFQIPLSSESQNFRQNMTTNAQNWLEGSYNPGEAGDDTIQSYENNPLGPEDYNPEALEAEKSEWGANAGYNAVRSSFQNQPYDASAYANDNYLWQSYYDLWNGNNSYVQDLTRDLNCSETVVTECEDVPVQDCREDVCIGYQTQNALTCTIYYDEDGNLHNECSQYEDNEYCFLLAEECEGDDEWACSGIPCWENGNCAIPSANGGTMGNTCCIASRVYACIDCSDVGGTPDPDWTQCPDDWKAHGKCVACLIATQPAQATVTVTASAPEVIHISMVDEDGSKYYKVVTGEDNTDNQNTPSVYGTNDVDLTITINRPEYFQKAVFSRIYTEDRGWITLEDGTQYCVPSQYNCSCGEDHDLTYYSEPVDEDVTHLFENDNQLTMTIHDCGGGDYSWTYGKFDIYVTDFFFCPEGYVYNPERNRCEIHQKGKIKEGSSINDCSKFQDNPDCHLVSSQCVTDENGDPVVDDDGNCYLYEYRYSCCYDIGTTQKCETSSDLQCAGLSCIGFNCRPEFDNSFQQNMEDAKKMGWFMNNAPFSEGEANKCIKKSLLMAKVDCCSLDDYVSVNALTYFKLAASGVKLIRNTDTFLKDLGVVEPTGGVSDLIQSLKDHLRAIFTGKSYDYIVKSRLDVMAAEDVAHTMGSTTYSQVGAFFSTVFRYANVAAFILNPDPVQILTDPTLRSTFITGSHNLFITAADKLLGQTAADTLKTFFQSTTMHTLGAMLNAVGIAITAYQVLQLICMIILGGCSEDDMNLAVKKKMGLCHYVGSYKKGGGLFSKKKIYRVYCCYKSPAIRIMMEQVKAQIGGWGTAKHPNCSGFTMEELSQIDWKQIKMDQIEAYERQAGGTPWSDQSIVEMGEQGGYGVSYKYPSDPENKMVTREYRTIDEAGHRANILSNGLQQQGFANPD